MFRGTTLLVAGLAGAILFAQAPEFAQQYRQRLGGAVEELRLVVTRFDADAAQHGMTRAAALQRYNNSPDGFFRTRGISINEIVGRYERLAEQFLAFEKAGPVMRPMLLAQGMDDKLMKDTMNSFRPAMPTTPEGGLYGFVGFIMSRMVWGTLLGLLGLGRRRRHS